MSPEAGEAGAQIEQEARSLGGGSRSTVACRAQEIYVVSWQHVKAHADVCVCLLQVQTVDKRLAK